MAVFKCKMCGGSLNIDENTKVCECEYCGTVQTVPSRTDENIQALFNRANILRMKSEFDKAEEIYEKIIQSCPNEPEAHWGLILCKFGIEYVEDPATYKRIPTCHRTSFDSITADDDYKEALRCADSVQRGIYEREAKEIDRLQKEILALSAKEEPYDVFICYKENDGGARTPDSVIANDIYYQLTNEGFKVFYAAITLENKLGSAYEPCIFAALNSAKVMLAIGTKPEFFNAVWVKNEWSRFLKMMKTDRSKLLIPCYKDMDAYELPEEFAHLQAQDMSKIGFINDVVRGIKRVITKNEPKQTSARAAVGYAVPSGDPTANSLIRRAFIFLEDGDFKNADEYCEKALDLDPENAQAYLGKLMAELKVRRREELKNCALPFDGSGNYGKIMRFGDEKLKSEVKGINSYIRERNFNAEQERVYRKALAVYNDVNSTDKDIEKARERFLSVPGYKDADEMARRCEVRVKEIRYQQALAKYNNTNSNQADIIEAKNLFLSVPGYKDADEMARNCDDRKKYLNDRDTFNDADKILGDGVKAYNTGAAEGAYVLIEEAIKTLAGAESLFQSIKHFEGAQKKIKECQMLADEYAKTVAKMKDAEKAAALARRRAAKKKKTIEAISALFILAAVGVTLLFVFYIIPEGKYNDAVELYNSGKYDEAYSIFAEINGYKDSSDKMAEIIAEPAAISAKNAAFISAGNSHTVGLKKDGTVVAVGENGSGQCDVSGWKDIIAVSAENYHTVGLKKDGTVVAVGDNTSGQCNVSDWKDIIAVSAGEWHTVGLKKDGTVVAVGKNVYGQCDVSDWKDIIAVSAGYKHTVGLKKDGTVVAVGYNHFGQCDVSGWKDIIAVSAGDSHTVGLKKDGTVVAVGSNSSGQCNVSDWKDIIAVSAGYSHTVGLKKDGTVVAVDRNDDMLDWKDIIAVSAGVNNTVGLKKDGSVVAVGWNYCGQCNVSDWVLKTEQ